MLKDVFSVGEYQEKATYGLGYKLTLTRIKDDAVIDKAAGIADARIKIDHFRWYVSHYIPPIQQQTIQSKQSLSRTPTELRYIERFVCYERSQKSKHMDIRIRFSRRNECSCMDYYRIPTKR